MPGNLQPLGQQFPIVNPDGSPTLYFIEWAQQKQIDISAGITAAQAQALIDDWAAARSIIAGNGLTGGGNLSADVTIDADASAILDLLSDTQGTVLYRGASAWVGLAPGTSGHFLKTNGAGANPEWAAGGGGGSAAWTVAGSWTHSVDVAEVDFTGLGSYNELLIQTRLISASVSSSRAVRLSTDNGSTFYSTSGNYVEIATNGADTNIAQMAIHGTSTTAARSGTIHLLNNVAGYVKSLHRVNIDAAAPLELFVASTDAVNAVRVFNIAGGNLTGGSILILGR